MLCNGGALADIMSNKLKQIRTGDMKACVDQKRKPDHTVGRFPTVVRWRILGN